MMIGDKLVDITKKEDLMKLIGDTKEKHHVKEVTKTNLDTIDTHMKKEATKEATIEVTNEVKTEVMNKLQEEESKLQSQEEEQSRTMACDYKLTYLIINFQLTNMLPF